MENIMQATIQTRYVHSDPSLLSLAIARKPDRLLSVAGYAPLDRCQTTDHQFQKLIQNLHFRSTISKIVFLTLLAVMLVANFKLSEKTS